MSTAYYVILRNHGSWIQPVSVPNVTKNSTVLASMCEMTGPDPNQGAVPFIGAAPMTVHGIAPGYPQDGSVEFRLENQWNSDLWIKLEIVVV